MTASRTLSWLTLEQYALGELDPAERGEVERQLEQSELDQQALRSIQEDFQQLPTLELPPKAAAAQPANTVASSRRRFPQRTLAYASAALAAAAALLLFRMGEKQLPPARRAVKGGDLALRVVSEQGYDAETFDQGERFKLLLTCPPQLSGTLDVVVFQGAEWFAPLPSGAAVECGNGMPWPDAFALDGADEVHVCVASQDATRRARAPEDLGETSVCVELHPR